jgi:hypothetical protein
VRNVGLLVLLLIIAGCGGGGGGGGGAIAQLVGRVLWVESNAATSPAASVTSGSSATTTDLIDGSFVLTVTPGTTSVTVSYSDGGPPVVFTFTFPAATGTVDLGDLYIGPETVTVHGTVTDSSTGSPLAGATVRLAGRTATTAANGEFNLLNVAYSSASPAAFGDLVGEVSLVNYVTRQFSPPIIEIGGVVEVGTLQITPESVDDPPPAPANLTGTVLPVNLGAGATVELLDGLTVVRTTTADGAGQYRIWAPVGTFTLRGTNGSNSGTVPVTISSPNVQQVVNVTIGP